MTPAQRNGIVHGKKYRVTATRDHIDGKIVVLDEDDDSSYPYFRVVNADGSLETERVCIDVTGDDPDEKLTPLEGDGEPLSYKIDVANAATTIIVNRALNTAKVKAILDIIGG